MSEDNLITQFMKIGLSEPKAKETIKNGVLCQRLKTILQLSDDVKAELPEQGTLYYHLASKMKTQHEKHLQFLVDYINKGKLNTTQRIDAALEFLLSRVEENVDHKLFDDYCGIGVVVTPDEIEQVVENIITAHKEELLKERYSFNIGSVLREVRDNLKWADGKSVKNEVDLQVLTLLGPKLESELTPNKKPKKVATKKTVVIENNVNESDKCSIIDVMKRLNFHKPGENHKTDGYIITNNTERLLKEHLKQTNGQVRTRFPPEPNGILHIGHAKAININFGYASAHNGVCILRYDDTNPEKEEKRFFDGIKDIVEWLGYKPFKITYSSDYFDQLYQLARRLINLGLAYVCHQNQSEMQGFNPPASPWRNRKPEENLRLFENMKNGLIDEGGATLRMKVTLEEGKQDPVAYRIKFLPHPRSGNKWCIYPTYDYTHCLCDSVENITHSLCTKEFQSRRSAYYWLCNSLDLYCPVQWEYGRLNMNYTVVSKRKIATLISEKIVNDWDDPRLFTLSALRRKGYPAEAINRFCAKMGVTGALCSVDPEMLEAEVRSILNDTAPRTMVVINPVKVTILNFSSLSLPTKITVDEFPDSPSKGNHCVSFSETIYIESSDFSKNPDKNYRRLTDKQPVGLRYAGIVIELSSVKHNKSGELVELLVFAQKASEKNKPKAFIHWVSNPITIQVNVYAPLFKHKEPENEPNGFLSDINTNSLSIFKSFADSYISKAKVRDVFQFERAGFYCVDDSSSDGLLVFNQTVSLKGDLGKS